MELDPSVRQINPFALRTSLGPVFKLILGLPIHDEYVTVGKPLRPTRTPVPIGVPNPSERGIGPKANRNRYDYLRLTKASEHGLVITMPRNARLFPSLEFQVYSSRHLSLTHGTPWPHQKSEPPPGISEQRPCSFVVIWAVYTTSISACAGAAGRVINPSSRMASFLFPSHREPELRFEPKICQSQNSDPPAPRACSRSSQPKSDRRRLPGPGVA